MTRKHWIGWMGSAILGGTCSVATCCWATPSEWLGKGWVVCKWVYEYVGVTIVALLPLAIWAARLFFKHVWRQKKVGHLSKTQLDFGYIARNSTVCGLIGTVLALATAGGRMAGEVSKGSAAAVLQMIPFVGQALFSTVLGLLIALAADTALHIIERKQIENKESTS